MKLLKAWFGRWISLLGRVNWGLVAVVVYALAWWLSFATALHAQGVTTTEYHTVVISPGSISFKDLDAYDGITTCYQGRMSSFVRVGLGKVESAAVAAHELKHQEQAARFNYDCERFNQWYNTPYGKLASEAEAFMAQYCYNVAHGGDPVTLMHDYTERLSWYFGGDANRLEIVAAVNQYNTCPTAVKKAVVADTSIMPGWQ